MRRVLGVLVLVLVLGAWSCVPVDDGGEPMAGPTTAGLAALIEGEGWHYVGETGEPAFENSWANVSGNSMLAFRIREAGVVDIAGVVAGGTPGASIFTLPEGYRPNESAEIPAIGRPVALTYEPAILFVDKSGSVTLRRYVSAVSTPPTGGWISTQWFLVMPDIAP